MGTGSSKNKESIKKQKNNDLPPENRFPGKNDKTGGKTATEKKSNDENANIKSTSERKSKDENANTGTSKNTTEIKSNDTKTKTSTENENHIDPKTGFPYPAPPKNRKKDIFKKEDFKDVDDHVFSLPQAVLHGDRIKLVKILTDREGYTDVHKIRAIFIYITRANPIFYSSLLQELCRIANIPCQVINGLAKPAGREKYEPKDSNSHWNAVFVAGSWRLINSHWASQSIINRNYGDFITIEADGVKKNIMEQKSDGYVVKKIEEFYFLCDPDQFIYLHFPEDKNWQLLENPISQSDFLDSPYIRETFHYLDMKIDPATNVRNLSKTVNGTHKFVFGLMEKNQNQKFSYKLSIKSSSCKEKIDLNRECYTVFERPENQLRYTFRFPMEGLYKFEVFGEEVGSTAFGWCAVLFIDCPERKKDCKPLVVEPKIGWGPTIATKEAGLKPKTHKDGLVTCEDGLLKVVLDIEEKIDLFQLLKHISLDQATLSKFAIIEVFEENAVIYLRFPEKGEYALQFFAKEKRYRGAAANVLNYLIECINTDKKVLPFPNVTNGILGHYSSNSDRLNARPISPLSGMIKTDNGQVSVTIEMKDNMEPLFEIFSLDSYAMENIITVLQNENGTWTLEVNVPVSGEYSLNIFGNRQGMKSGTIYIVHTYLIESQTLKQIQHKNKKENRSKDILTKSIKTSQRNISFPVPRGHDNIFAAIHMRNGSMSHYPNQVRMLKDKNDRITEVEAELEDFGDYMLNIYTLNDEREHQVTNVARYQITREIQSETNIPDSLDVLREKIKQAMQKKDITVLRQAVKKYLNEGGIKEEEIVKKANQMINTEYAKERIKKAIKIRELRLLKQAIKNAVKHNKNGELDKEINEANKLVAHLTKVHSRRHAVLDMNQETLMEIRSYNNPRVEIQHCMMATFVLLGHKKKDLQDWLAIQALLGKCKQQIKDFNLKKVPIKRAESAKKLIDQYKKREIQDLSAGAATFFLWCKSMVTEVLEIAKAEEA